MTLRTLTVAIVVTALCANASAQQRRPIAKDLPGILARLKSADIKARDAAEEELMRRARAGLDSDDGIALLHAAAEEPATEGKPIDQQIPSAVLIRTAAVRPVELYLPALRQMFPTLEAPAQFEALELLVKIHSVTAARMYVQLAEEHAKSLEELPIETLRAQPEFAEIYFPALLKVAADAQQLGESIYLLTLEYADQGKLEPDKLEPEATSIVASYNRRHGRLVQQQQQTGLKWRWAPAYHADREPAGVLLDLMGYLPAASVQAALQSALALSDPKLKLYAATSIIRHSQVVPYRELDLIASDDESRSLLFAHLQHLNRLDLFPEKFRAQEPLARSIMVQWLIYPTELGRAPDQIELMTVLPASDPARGDYYIYRFRADDAGPDKEGWRAGIAGPFKSGEPTVQDGGDTFSAFEKWETATAGDHLLKILAAAKEVREKQKPEQGAPVQHSETPAPGTP